MSRSKFASQDIEAVVSPAPCDYYQVEEDRSPCNQTGSLSEAEPETLTGIEWSEP